MWEKSWTSLVPSILLFQVLQRKKKKEKRKKKKEKKKKEKRKKKKQKISLFIKD